MKMLIAEDQMHLGRLLAQLVEDWGYQAEVVHDGLAALQKLAAPGAARLALLDWVMPGLAGIDVCREVRKDKERPYAYIVLTTAQHGRERMLEALEAGADDFLVKPVDDAELKARLATGKRIVTLQEQLRDLATRDALTGLWNRAAILDMLERELARGRRESRPVGVILADLDHFKQINDTLGHLAGDAVLRQAAQRMLAVLRPYDSVGRYGGEEFLVVLPGCDAIATLGLAERLRQSIAAEPMLVERGPISVTLSVGVAAAPAGAPPGQLLRAADEALYHAKADGRNRAVLGKEVGQVAD
jgi:diguanylate cyclase (GGDEF)-like protein